MNDAQIAHYLQPGVDALGEMTDAARTDVLAALVAAVVHPQAQELADAFEGAPMAKLREAAAPDAAAVSEARAALAKEKESVSGRVAAFWQSKRRADPDDREHAPDPATPKVQELQATLTAAEQAAVPSESRCRSLGYTIDKLRGTRAPDPAVLAVLASVLCGCTVDAPVNSASISTTQAPQATRARIDNKGA